MPGCAEMISTILVKMSGAALFTAGDGTDSTAAGNVVVA